MKNQLTKNLQIQEKFKTFHFTTIMYILLILDKINNKCVKLYIRSIVIYLTKYSLNLKNNYINKMTKVIRQNPDIKIS